MKKTRLAVLALVLSAPFWDLGHPLWEVDDARYAEVPRELQAAGWPAVPTLDGMDYVEKPPLIYWLGAASYAAFGVSEAAGRLPLALTALAGLAGAWWLGAWLFSPATGTAAALVLGTSVLYGGLSHMITPDMTLAVCLLWACALALRALERPADALWAAPAAWLAAALAFLAKGLVALLLPGMWFAAMYALQPARRAALRRFVLGPGPVVFAAVVVPWLWMMERAVPGFWRVFFLEQHFQRFLDTGKYNRPGPWWYFLATDAWGFLPWAPAALAALALPLWRRRSTDPRDLSLALWPALVLAFFSVSSSKLPTYLLPAFPFQALLTARLLNAPAPPWLRRTGAALGALLLLAAALLPAGAARLPPPLSAADAVLGAAALAAMGGAVLWASRGPEAAALAAAGALAFQAAALVAARRFEPYLSARPVARAAAARASLMESEAPGTPVRLVAYDRYLHGLPYYTGRLVDVVNWVGELHYAKRFERFSHRFGDDSQLRAWPRPGERVLVVAPRSQVPWITRTREGAVGGVEAVGPYAVLELTAPRSRPSSAAGRGPARG